MTTAPRRGPTTEDASVIPAVRGLPSWAAIVVAVGFTALGVVLSWTISGNLGWTFKICFGVGVVLAVLAVRRGSIFTAMVQAPIILAPAVLIGSVLINGQGLVYNAFDVVKAFPMMATTTAAVLVIGLVRIIAQPLRHTSKPARSRPAAGV